MKKFLFLLLMALPLNAYGAEHGGKAMSKKAPAGQSAGQPSGQSSGQSSGQPAEHAGEALKKKCDPLLEECAKPKQNKATSEHGGQPVKKKADEHPGSPAQ